MDDLTQQARDALLKKITTLAGDTRTNAGLTRDLAEAYERVTGSPKPSAPPPSPVGVPADSDSIHSRDW